jgi:penicillin-binding protein 2
MSINEGYKKKKVYVDRILFFIIGIAFCFLLIISRLIYLQLIKHGEYETRSESNRIKLFIIPSERGIIYDRNGVELSVNRDNYRVLLYKNRNYNPLDLVESVASILEFSPEKKKFILEKIAKERGRPIVSVVDNLDWDELTKVEIKSFELPGITTEKGKLRQYLYPEETAHLIGYVSTPSEDDLEREGKNNKILFMHPDFRIGKNGIEKTFEKHLRGTPGLRYMEVNAYGIPIRRLSLDKGEKGRPINLTVDIELQKIIAKKMKGRSGSVIVMDVKTGEVLGIFSAPTFNPNEFVEKISVDRWNELLENPSKPLNNKAISAIYPPGSTIKPVVILAALEAGINPKNKVNCLGKTFYGSRKFHCWKESGHGLVDMKTGIKRSCNIYFSRIGLRTGIDNISKMLTKFGIGQGFDIGLPYGSKGIVPSKKWKKKVLREGWYHGDTINTSIGQGFMLVTPLELVVMVSRIANGGYPVKPYLIEDDEKKEKNLELFSNKAMVGIGGIEVVHKGMVAVVNEKGGTAYWARIRKKGYEMAGKTGTAQVIKKKTKESMEKSKDGIKNQFKNHALFVGFAPIKEPKYGIVVVVEHGGHGSSSAAPVARDVLLALQKMEKKRAKEAEKAKLDFEKGTVVED